MVRRKDHPLGWNKILFTDFEEMIERQYRIYMDEGEKRGRTSRTKKQAGVALFQRKRGGGTRWQVTRICCSVLPGEEMGFPITLATGRQKKTIKKDGLGKDRRKGPKTS